MASCQKSKKLTSVTDDTVTVITVTATDQIITYMCEFECKAWSFMKTRRKKSCIACVYMWCIRDRKAA